MKPISGPLPDPAIEADFWRELAELEAEAIGWLPLAPGCYLHVGSDQNVIEVVGQATASMSGGNVLWVG